MAEITTGTTVATIAPELQVIDGHVTTTSTQVAQHFNKRHDTVLRAIRNMLDELDVDHARNFAEMVVEVEIGKGAIRKDPAYRMTRDGFTLLAMGFTGKEALQWKLAYIDTFNKMEAALTSASPYITAAQRQHLRELVQLVVESGKQSHGETWNRLHRKFKVNEYKLLRHEQFDAACEYLRGKMDGQSMAALVQKHFPSEVFALQTPVVKPAPRNVIRCNVESVNVIMRLTSGGVGFGIRLQGEHYNMHRFAQGEAIELEYAPGATPLADLPIGVNRIK